MNEEKNLNHSLFASKSSNKHITRLTSKKSNLQKSIREYAKWIYEEVKFYNYYKIIAGPIWHKIQLTHLMAIFHMCVSHIMNELSAVKYEICKIKTATTYRLKSFQWFYTSMKFKIVNFSSIWWATTIVIICWIIMRTHREVFIPLKSRPHFMIW